MAKEIILLADNDPDFLSTRKEYLELEGYTVIAAHNPTEARRLLEQHTVDLAILDVRLIDDGDQNDTSGLTLAKDLAFRTIPKIILTSFPSAKAAREALRTDLDGLPGAMDFVPRDEGPEAMVTAIRLVIGVTRKTPRKLSPVQIQQDIRSGLRTFLFRPREGTSPPPATKITLNVSAHLHKDYEIARREVDFLFWARLILVVVSISVIIAGGVLVLTGHATTGILTAVAGIFSQALAAMFNKLSADAQRRWHLYHQELVRLHKEERISKGKVKGKKQ